MKIVWWGSNCVIYYPTNDITLINVQLRNFVKKHRLSIQIGMGMQKWVCHLHTVFSDWASILHTSVGGWVGELSKNFSRCPQTFSSRPLLFLFLLPSLPPFSHICTVRGEKCPLVDLMVFVAVFACQGHYLTFTLIFPLLLFSRTNTFPSPVFSNSLTSTSSRQTSFFSHTLKIKVNSHLSEISHITLHS